MEENMQIFILHSTEAFFLFPAGQKKKGAHITYPINSIISINQLQSINQRLYSTKATSQ